MILGGMLIIAALVGGVTVSAQDIASDIQSDEPRANEAESAGYSVKVAFVQPKPTEKGRTFYAITFSYDFKGRKSINIKGLGQAPPKGQFSYLSTEDHLEFQDTVGRAVVTVPLKVTKAPEGGSTDMPTESDFKPFFLSESRPDATGFHLRAQSVLNSLFPSGYAVRQSGGISYYMTTYRPLEGLPENLRGQVAVMISHPYDASGDRFNFRVQFVARQKPKKSGEWQYELPDDTRRMVEELVKRLTADLRAQ
jgi:hypothetical protein